MTPIDDELRTALHRRAESVAPPADPLAAIERRAGRIRRHRVAAAVAGTTLAVAAVVVAVPVVIDGLSDASGHARDYTGGSRVPPPPTATPTAAAETPPGGPGGLVNFLAWPARGRADERFDNEIGRLWARQHHLSPEQAGSSRLWQSALPGGGRAGVWQFWSPGTEIGYTVVGQRLPNGYTFILRDTVTPRDVKEISSVLQGGAFPHVVVLGPPTTAQVRYAADGLRFAPVENLPGFVGGDRWAVFDRTGPAIDQKLPDRIELLDGKGGSLYRGTIDVGPSLPDK